MPKLIPKWLWPCLTPPSPKDECQQEKWLSSEREKVAQGSWTNKSHVALEEARRLFDAEQERRRGADSKAGLYIAAITALMPLLATTLPDLWGEQPSKALQSTQVGIFIFALLYLMHAGLWALKTIKVSGTTQLSPGEIAQIFSSEKPEEKLVTQLLKAVVYNYTGTNQKVSYIKMTHEFLLRAFFCFVVFLAVQVAWPTAAWTIGRIHNEIITPLMSCIR